MPSSSLTLEEFKKWYEQNKQSVLNDFVELLKFKSISTDKNCKSEIEKTAFWIRVYLEKIGFHAEVLKTKNQPLVFAEKKSATHTAKTLLFYGHFDVQPVDPLSLWDSPPFEPEIRNGNIYARGALDNKGQMFYTLVAINAFLNAFPEAPLHLKVFIEGEEESGGEGTEGALIEYKDKFIADELYVVDFDIKSMQEPTIPIGTRGILAMELKISNSFTDLHSGVHGGIALNPLRVLSHLIADFWDAKGEIAIDGFYSDVIAISDEDRKKIDFSFDRDRYIKEFGVQAFAIEEGLSATESNWLRPCLEINGLSGGYTQEGFKTVLPSMAHAKFSCRLVPGQDPLDIAAKIEAHIRAKLPKGIHLEFEVHHMAEAFRTDTSTSCVKKTKEAFEEVFNKKCHFVLCGASVPIVPVLKKATGAEVCLLGMGLETDNIHAPNEHFSLERFYKGFLIISSILYKSAYTT